VVEAPGDLAGHLDMRHLVLAHRHLAGLVDEDVGALQQRIAEEAVGGEILLLELFLLILVARHPLQPAERRDHGQQQVQLRVLRHPRLDEQPVEAPALTPAASQSTTMSKVACGMADGSS
jgi:hypothetical protein